MTLPERPIISKEETMLAQYQRHIEDKINLWAYIGMMHGQGIYPESFLREQGHIIDYETMTIKKETE